MIRSSAQSLALIALLSPIWVLIIGMGLRAHQMRDEMVLQILPGTIIGDGDTHCEPIAAHIQVCEKRSQMGWWHPMPHVDAMSEYTLDRYTIGNRVYRGKDLIGRRL